MSNPLLSWDDFEEDEVTPIKNAVNQEAALRAVNNLAKMDISEGVKELEEQGAAIERNKALKESGLIPQGGTGGQPLFSPNATYTKEQMAAIQKANVERAKGIIAIMNAQLESGGRVGVDEKYLLNCKADLNQLVPFKYNWAWSLYLTSCENHWMPAELSLERGKASFDQIVKGTPKKLLARWYFNLLYRKHDFNNTMLLNCYRIITNPECRQYILRLGFENSILDHVQTDMNEIFDPNNIVVKGTAGKADTFISRDQWAIDGWTFKNRSKVIRSMTTNLRDFEYNTVGEEKTGMFLEELAYAFFYSNWAANIVPSYQLMYALQTEGKGHEIVSLLTRQLKDIQFQTSFIKLFLSTAFEENPTVLTEERVARMNRNFAKFYDLEFDLAGTLANTDTESKDVTDLVRYYANDFLGAIGIQTTSPNVQLNDNNLWFAQLVSSLQPHVNHEAGLSGNGGSLGW